MANNYTTFSFGIKSITPKEETWIREYLTAATKLGYEGEVDKNSEETALTPTQRHDPFYRAVKENGYIGFSWNVEPEAGKPFLWLYSEDSGTPGMAALFVQRFLQTHRPKQFITFSWADTCSKPRLNEFGGGAYVIHAKWMTYTTTYRFTNRHAERLLKRGFTRSMR
jgi:hypothetical protein